MTSYAVPLYNTLNFSLAPMALALNTPKFRLKRRKIAIFSIFCRRRAKNGRFFFYSIVLNVPNFVPKTAQISKRLPFIFFFNFCAETRIVLAENYAHVAT